MALTLGTGVGSGFVAGRRLVTSGDEVPANGWVYCLPFEGGIVDEAFSTRWVCGRYRELTGQEISGAREAAERHAEDPAARRLFDEYGERLAAFAAPVAERFRADMLVLGGNISRAYPLFGPAMERRLEADGHRIRIGLPARPDHAALIGALLLLLAEGRMVFSLALARYSTMYLSLPLVLWLLFRFLQSLDLPPRPGLRPLSTAVYLLHPWLIVALRGFARLTGLTTLLMDNDFLHFLAVACLSLAAGALFCRFLRPRPSPAPARCWAEIDLSALRHNLGALRARIPPECALMAVVKADGYGHGAVQIARFCAGEGVGAFAVATVNEGATLRRAGIKGDILVLGRTFPPEFSEAHRRNLILTVADPVHAEELAAFGKSLRLHVAVDTGMHRLGFPSSEVDAVAAVYRAPRLRAEGLFTHLCAADSDTPSDRAFTHSQIDAFFALAANLKARGIDPGVLHIQASAGIYSCPALPCSLVRPGLALYGVGSSGLRPVLTLKCRVAAIHVLAPGDMAGCGRTFTASRPTRLAVLSIGYADGFPRALGGRGHALIAGKSAPIVGRVCMDQTLCDVTAIPAAVPGCEAVLIGSGLDAAAVAGAAETIPNELLSRLGVRVQRVYRMLS